MWNKVCFKIMFLTYSPITPDRGHILQVLLTTFFFFFLIESSKKSETKSRNKVRRKKDPGDV